MGLAADGRWNRRIGWALLVAGFVWAAWLDPWALSEHDPARLDESGRLAARHAQAVVLTMAFLQLLTAELISGGHLADSQRRAVAALTGAGAVVYAAGYVLDFLLPGGAWLVPFGALLNCGGFAVFWWRVVWQPGVAGPKVILPILCLGMLLDAGMGVFRADPVTFFPACLGPDDGVRLRMLRLARVAVTALSVTALLFERLAARAGGGWTLARWGQVALWCGVMGMPTVLAAAAFISIQIKYLLPIPALTTFAGVCVAVGLSLRNARPLETWGWVLAGASMGAGLLMGLYAFDGPAPAPDFLGAYNEWPRRLSRLGHAYCILLGLLGIFLARVGTGSEAPTRQGPARGRFVRAAELLFAAASAATLLAVVLVAFRLLPAEALGVGPAAVAAAVVFRLASGTGAERGGHEDRPDCHRGRQASDAQVH
jgi:hypothetical protein